MGSRGRDEEYLPQRTVGLSGQCDERPFLITQPPGIIVVSLLVAAKDSRL